MRNRTVLLVAVLVVGAVGGPVAGVAGADVTLTVAVTTAAGDPVSDAKLTLTWEGGSATGTTAANGKAFVDVPEGVDVTIEVQHPGYVRNEPKTVEDVTEGQVNVTVWQRSSAEVTVVDSNGPVADVRVVFRKQGRPVAVRSTGPDGTVETGVIEAGDYALTLQKAGYYRAHVPLDVRGETNEEVRIRRGSVSVEFRVLDENFDPPEPVANATITGPDFSTATQPDGQRTVSLPVNTELTVTVEKPGYEPVERRITVNEQELQVIVRTTKRDAVHLELASEQVVVGESVQVTVTDQYDEPLPEATVYLDGQPVGQPNDEGALSVPIESAGEHTLSAQAGQLTSSRLPVTGVQPGGGTPASGGSNADDGASFERPAGFLRLPGVGPVHLRSAGIGIGIGLLLALLLFLYARIG